MSKPWCAFFKRVDACVAGNDVCATVCTVLLALALGVATDVRAAPPVPASTSTAAAERAREAELASLTEVPFTLAAKSGAELRVGDTVSYSFPDPAWRVDAAEGGLTRGFLFRPGRLFTPLMAGTLRLPALRVIDESGAAVAKTAPLEIPVASNLTEKELQDPKGPRPEAPLGPLGLPFPPWLTSLVAFSILACLIVGAFFLVRYLRRKAAAALKAILPKKPYDLATLERLDALAKSDYAAKRAFKPLYFGISESLKFYLGERYRFDAQESTTSELLARLRGSDGEPGPSEGIVLRLEKLFAELDPVKFADHAPTEVEAREVLREAREIVLATRKTEAEPILKDAAAAAPGKEAR